MYRNIVEKIRNFEEVNLLYNVIDINVENFYDSREFLIVMEKLKIVNRSSLVTMLREEFNESFILFENICNNNLPSETLSKLKSIGVYPYSIDTNSNLIILATEYNNPEKDRALLYLNTMDVKFVYITPLNFIQINNPNYTINKEEYLMFLRIIVDGIINGATDIRFSAFSGKTNYYPIRYRIGNKSKYRRYFDIDEHTNKVMAESISKFSIYDKVDIEVAGGVVIPIFDPFSIGNYSLRVSIEKTLAGFLINVRVFGDKRIVESIESLGFDKEINYHLNRMTNFTRGLTLTTGPQRSGKTTTNTAIMNQVIKKEITVLEMSSPPETEINADQMSYSNDKELFRMISATKKQDLDVALVAEIPDKITGDLIYDLVNSSIGVFTTFHIDRIWHLCYKLDEYYHGNIMNIVTHLKYVICQKAFEEQCEHCRKEMFTSTSKLDTEIKSILEEQEINVYYESVGCEHCKNTGLKRGIRPFVEVIFFDGNLKEEISKCESLYEMEKVLKKNVFDNRLNMEVFVYRAIRSGKIHPNSLYELM